MFSNKKLAVAVSGAVLLMAGQFALADSTTDIVDALVSKGVLTEEEGKLISKGAKTQKEAEAKAAKAKEFDFINSDAPFKYETKLAGHDANIQFYGIIDIGGAHVNHTLNPNSNLPNSIYPYSYDAAGGKTITGVASRSTWIQGGLQDSRFGLKGDVSLFEAMDNKFKLIYQFEGGFDPLTGSLNNAAKALSQNWDPVKNNAKLNSTFADSSLNGDFFARQAWAGVDGGKLGKVSYGIQYNPFYDIASAYDPNHKADSFSPLGESGAIGGGGGLSPNARMKNSLKYANSFEAPMDGKVNVVGMYQFGNDINAEWGRGYAGQIGYENSLFGFQLAYNNFTDTVKVDVADSLTNIGTGTVGDGSTLKAGLYDTQAFMATAKYTPSKEIKFSGGYEWMQLSQPTDKLISYGSLYGYSILGGVASTLYNSSKSVGGSSNHGDHQNIDFWWVGGEYDFGQRFAALDGLTLSGAYYYTKYGTLDGVDANNGKAGVAGKDFHIDTETVDLDYKLNKRFDVYGAATWNQFGGTYVSTMLNKDVNAYGVGVRMKF